MKSENMYRWSSVYRVVSLAIALGVGVWIGGMGAETASTEPMVVSDNAWTCSMHPQIQQAESGDCPLCGMDLVLLDATSGEEQSVHLSDHAMKLAQLQTQPVVRAPLVKETTLRGTVQVSETTEFAQTSHVSGRIERLMVTYKGQAVQKGDVVAWVYSPELVTAQEELLEAAKLVDSNPGLLRAAKAKLRNWKLNDAQINAMLRRGRVQEEIPIVADLSGTVMRLNVALGDHLTMGQTLYELADLSTAWVMFDLYERDLPWVKIGDVVSFSTRAQPQHQYTGSIQFIDPVLSDTTRTSKARVLFDNAQQWLKAGQWVSGRVESTLMMETEPLLIPKSAVLWTGNRSLVYRKSTRGDAQQGIAFEPVEVELGVATSTEYVVISGLKEGEEVVTQGAFVVDSAAQLSGLESMMSSRERGQDELTNPIFEDTSAITVSSQTGRGLRRVLQGYLSLKDALVSSDLESAVRETVVLKSRVAKLSTDDFEPESQDDWRAYQQRLTQLLDDMDKASELSSFRSDFAQLSEVWIQWMRRTGPLETELYVQLCPMAEHNQGAQWLSSEPEIANPYFGDAMLRCGEVVETLNP